MWRKGEKGDLVLRVEVEMPDQEWALKLRGEGGVSLLEGLLPSKREDVQAPEETDEVELVERRKGEGEGEVSFAALFAAALGYHACTH